MKQTQNQLVFSIAIGCIILILIAVPIWVSLFNNNYDYEYKPISKNNSSPSRFNILCSYIENISNFGSENPLYSIGKRLIPPKQLPFLSPSIDRLVYDLYLDIVDSEEGLFPYNYSSDMRYNSRFGLTDSYSLDGWATNNIQEELGSEVLTNLSKLPYSDVNCSYGGSRVERDDLTECYFYNLYYDIDKDNFYFYRDPNAPDRSIRKPIGGSDGLVLDMNKDEYFSPPPHTPSFIITKPVAFMIPPHENFGHGFMETNLHRFTVLTRLQERMYGIDPNEYVFWLDTGFFNIYPGNKQNLHYFDNENVQYKAHVHDQLHPLLSHFPLAYSQQPNFKSKGGSILFREAYALGYEKSKIVFQNRNYFWYEYRTFNRRTYSDREFSKSTILFGDYILRRFGLPSKFVVPKFENDDYIEYIVVVNRQGVNRREIKNAQALVDSLRQVYPDSGPNAVLGLRVWPTPYSFQDNMDLYKEVKFSRKIRIMITVHGAQNSHMLFMRPGGAVLELQSARCDYLGDCFGALARSSSLHFYEWSENSPSSGQPTEHGRMDNYHSNSCNFEANILVDVEEVTDIVIDLVEKERLLRDGMYANAIMMVKSTHPKAQV